ncbi:MAG: ribosome maturation factor RimM [Bdellovibrionales bacterium]|nr:ribosome maturation factor RimM [Bdellovibrionales bacterium]
MSFLQIGKITRVHGLKGEVFVSLFSPSEEISSLVINQMVQIYRTSIEKAPSRASFPLGTSVPLGEKKRQPETLVPAKAGKPALAERQGSNRSGIKDYIKTSIQKARSHKEGLIIKFKGIDTKLEAEALKGAVLSVPQKIFSSLKGENIYLCEVLNFKVYDQKMGALGTIRAFSSNGAQDLLLVQDEKGIQREIPFIDEFVIHVHFDLKKVQVHLPSDWPCVSRF